MESIKEMTLEAYIDYMKRLNIKHSDVYQQKDYEAVWPKDLEYTYCPGKFEDDVDDFEWIKVVRK